MRIYEGSPRQDFEEVFRSIGAFIDQRGMRDILLVEAPDGFIVQGLVISGASSGSWSDTMGTLVKETLTFVDDDIARFMEEAAARRNRTPPPPPHVAGRYESAFRVIGRYIDEQKPHDVFFFEQEGAFVLRLMVAGAGGPRAATTRSPNSPRTTSTGWSPRAPASAIPRTNPGHAPRRRPDRSSEDTPMKALKTVAVALGITLGALIVIPLAVLAGLFVWLKLTEEADEEILDLDSEGA